MSTKEKKQKLDKNVTEFSKIATQITELLTNQQIFRDIELPPLFLFYHPLLV